MYADVLDEVDDEDELVALEQVILELDVVDNEIDDDIDVHMLDDDEVELEQFELMHILELTDDSEEMVKQVV